MLGIGDREVQLRGKVAVVTGASRGLGKTIAIELTRAGAAVAVVARTADVGQNPLSGRFTKQ